ncbi:MAG: HEAT repeat domain-containing protein [Desulfobacteraceae bacterium]|nr:HEAT repeat domain-containing protein [Desulfobacteraceae bacterium]
MIVNRKHTSSPPKVGDGKNQAANEALTETCKALKAVTFYPSNHPLREKIPHNAYQALIKLMDKDGVSLIVQRNGLSIAGNASEIENTPMVMALAKELFTREIQGLTLLPQLSLTEFIEFLSLLALDSNKVIEEGGLAGMLAKRGIQTIICNKIDISEVYSKKRLGEAADDSVAEGTVVQEDHEEITSPFEGALPDHLNDLKIEEVLALMLSEEDDNRYQQLSGILLVKGQSLKAERDFNRLYPVLLGLVDQNADVTKSTSRRNSSLMVFQQLARGQMAEHLLDHLEDKDFGQQEFVYLILNQLGSEVVNEVISRFVAADNEFAKYALATAIHRIGQPAVPALIEMLKDRDWQVVRSAINILGEMKSRDSVKGLMLTAYHNDTRLRLESVRSLARIGGREATEALIDLLQDDNLAVRKQAIEWIGHTGNQKGLDPLIQMIKKRDVLGKMLYLKKEALLAIGRIGDRQSLDPLFRIAKKRHWIFPSRQEELQILAAETIASLGGESAKEFLEKLAARSGRIGRASSSALKTMGQRAANNHE